MRLTAEQIGLALRNSAHKPHSHAPVIWEALKKGKPAPLADGYGLMILTYGIGIHYGTDPTESQK